MRRSQQRRLAVFTLYDQKVTGRPIKELLPGNARQLIVALVLGVLKFEDELDRLIDCYAHRWEGERIKPLERSIMQVALLEIKHPELVPGDRPVPPEVAIDEAIKTAKEYCSDKAPAFINGILDAAWNDLRQNNT